MLGKKVIFLWPGLALIFFVSDLIGAQAQQERTSVERIMDFYAVNRQTREPLTEVMLTVRVSADNYKKQQSWDEKTDSKGFYRIKLPDFQIETLRLYPRKKGFVPLFVMWRGIPTPPELPKVFTIAMEPSTTIGGIVKNERGEPIEGVAVGVHYQTPDPGAAENVYVDIMIHNALETDIKTDAAGRWSFDQMPAEIDKNELRIFLKHPSYLSDQLRPGFIPMPITRQPSIESLRDLSAVMVMKEGLEVTGKVTDERSKPIAGAKIYDVDNYWYRSTKPFAETDAQGQFRSNANPGTATWTIQMPGYAPDLKDITIREGMPPIEIRLEPGRVIEGKVTDQAGKPIEGASISAEDWRKSRRRLHLEVKTDAEGRFKVVDAPSDEVTFDIGKEGYMLLENYPMKPGGTKYNITLRPTLKVRGTVIDAQTGRPIDKFTTTNGIDPEDGRAPHWQEFDVRTFRGGQYELEFKQEIFTYCIRVDAEGYQSALSRRIRPEEIAESSIVCDFKLDKTTALTGTVLSPDGTPLSGAEVVIATDWLRIVNGEVDSRSAEQNLILHTDANGEFHFEPPVSSYTIVVLNEQSYAKISQAEFNASKVITVSPWGRIEGTLRIGAQPDRDKLVVFLPDFRQEQEQRNIRFEYEVQTDKEGHYIFLQLLPGKGTVARATPIDARTRRFSYHIDTEVTSGQTTRVQIGGTGRPVVGKVVIPDIIENIFDWQYTDCSMRVSSPISPPYKVLLFECDKDGSFRVEDVPTGDYCLYMYAYGPPPDIRSRRGERIGVLTYPFTIPEMPGGQSDEPLDLGELELEVIGKSALIPSLVGKPLPDLAELKIDSPLAQAKGKMVLICFWDMNQRPSRNCITQLAKQAEQLTQKGVIVAAIQVSKIDQNALNEWVKKNNIPFPIGMAQDDEKKTHFTWGIKSLPWLILTDRKHIVRVEGFGLDNLNTMIEEMNNVVL
jgi:5-hydroxyisourate hydrolase-like protein (transthyretin family)